MKYVDEAVGPRRLTVSDIVTGLQLEHDKATIAKKPLWLKLIGLAGELDREQGESELTRHRWSIVNCTITDFRGVSGTLSVDFRSEADVTVFHGENGSGKSSLTAAVRMALEGAVGVTHAGIAIKSAKALWVSGDDRYRGAGASRVEVRLQAVTSPATELKIRADYDGTEVLRSATITDADEQPIEFRPEDPAWIGWDVAVRSAPPVFAYAELADELKARGDLQAWISKCLAMDVASRDLDGAVAGAVSSAGDAVKRINDAILQTKALFEEIDQRAYSDGLQVAPEVDWDGLWASESIDTWRLDNALNERASSAVALPGDLVRRIDNLVASFRLQRGQWAAAATGLITPAVGQGIVALSEAVELSHQSDAGAVCPVCGSASSDWRHQLETQAARFDGAQKAWRAIEAESRAAEWTILTPLVRALESAVGETHDATDGEARFLTSSRRLLDSIRDPQSAVDLVSATEAFDRAWEPDTKDAVSQRVARSDRLAAWHAERVSSAEALFEILENDLTEARSYEDWKKARVLWNPFLASLRNERVSRLEDQFSKHLREMLADVGFSLSRLNVKKNDTDIDIVDAAGRRVELSFLSAGQRNALILAPVLAQSGLGLFNFILIDDPVHAFDEFRVDRLASTLVRLGTDSPLIITTHDGRFVEYLRAHLPERYSVVRVKRNHDGAIRLIDTDAPWTMLFNQATILMEGETPLNTIGRRDVCTLLRMGFDAALESFVHRATSASEPEEREAALRSFDSASTTTARLEAARRMSDTGFDQAISPVRGYLDDWSLGVHTDMAVELDLREQIAAARLATKALARL